VRRYRRILALRPMDDSHPVQDLQRTTPATTLGLVLDGLRLAELRDIARNRSWPAKAQNKTELVRTIVERMRDRTEVARAVFSLPPTLQQALVAALVAEDGSGITPQALSRTVNALAGPSQPALKPIDADSILRDLSKSALVIPWRGLANGPHYLFPVEVQRLVPNLPAWCPSCANPTAAEHPTHSTSDLGTLFQPLISTLSARPPALADQHSAPAAKRTSALVGDWPVDLGPQPGRGSSPNRTVASLRVRTPFLLAEDDMTRLSEAIQCDKEVLEFLLRLLVEAGLARPQDERLIPRQEQVRSFQRRSEQEQQQGLSQAYLSLTDWSELDVCLRSRPEWVLIRHPAVAHSYTHFRAYLRRLRHTALRLVATCTDDSWCRLTALERALMTMWRGAEPLGPFSDPMSPHPANTRPWSLVQGAAEPEGIPQQDLWQDAIRALVRCALQLPLRVLGLAELGLGPDQVECFHSHGLSSLLWDRPAPERHPAGRGPLVSLADDGSTILASTQLAPLALLLLGRLGRIKSTTHGQYLFELDAQSVHGAFTQSTLEDIISDWERLVPDPMPLPLRERLTGYWEQFGQIRLYEGLALLEVADELTMREIEATTSLGTYLVARISPLIVAIPDEDCDTLLAELAARGYPHVIDRGPNC